MADVLKMASSEELIKIRKELCQLSRTVAQIQIHKPFIREKYTDMHWIIMRLKPMRVYLPHYFVDCYYIANILTSAKRAG